MLDRLKELLISSEPAKTYAAFVKGVTKSDNQFLPPAIYTLEVFNIGTPCERKKMDVVTPAILNTGEVIPIKYQRKRILGIPIASEKIVKNGQEFDIYDPRYVGSLLAQRNFPL